MAILLGIPVIILVVILQTVVITTLPLLNGIADLVLLVVAACHYRTGWKATIPGR